MIFVLVSSKARNKSRVTNACLTCSLSGARADEKERANAQATLTRVRGSLLLLLLVVIAPTIISNIINELVLTRICNLIDGLVVDVFSCAP